MRPPRLEGCSYRGPRQYFLTICAYRRRRVFIAADIVDAVWEQFLRTAVDCDFAVIAYCLMPDHVHVLVAGLSDDADLRRFAELAKQRSAHAARPHVRGRLWQRGYFDRVLRDDEDPYEVVRYVVQNPVRARLVEQIQAYPFVGSSILALQDLLDHCAWKPR